ncbi:Mitogen-activated protein kinase kinase [Actinidia chinensis var. chinensis]|uniref:mitogen-activated protein kinase kinase kinase n=1 Tax=Actinidia chinensis var. chinensis TaxID=1590841 RepID=A0A2R6RBI8_ACTCC|nr:Mitogen-activated protein kinase kinase [Actinidia chinensis var. chinensis]
MQDIFGSVRRSLVFRSPDGGGEEVATSGTLVDKISYRIRKSRVFSKPCPPPPMAKDESTPIRWRKGELIGCGAFGRVYMGMNLDSGELLAVKQVLVAGNSALKEKAQTHVSELEEEVKLLKNLSHPNIVRYLGTVREDETLNILLEFVPGGSISSLLGKFGSFPESVIKMYTKQLLVGLDYLHNNGIMHRDIKGANILVDNKGCIKLADFGASKQVVELATVSGAKSMKGTPYWMAPEVILQTGHSFSADIWSVGCTVIEMATGKPPWSQQYQEVAALFYIGTTKSHPPIPEHLSHEAKDFLLKCLQKEPESRPAACELLQHLFVTGESAQSTVFCSSSMESSKYASASCGTNQDNYVRSMDICNLGSLSCSTVNFDKLAESRHIWGAHNSEDDVCQIDDKDEFVVGREEKSSSGLIPDNFNESFNPMCEPSDDWRCKDGKSLGPDVGRTNLSNNQPVEIPADSFRQSGKGDSVFSFQCTSSLSEDDDEATESKIKAFLDEKALELKKLQTPLYEEFYNSFNASCSPSFVEKARDENSPNFLKLPPKSQSPNRVPSGTPSAAVDGMNGASPGSSGRQASDVGGASHQGFQDTPSPQHNDRRGFLADADQEASPSFSERQKKWKEELDQELERKREMMRQAGVGGKTSSPKDRALSQPRERSRFASPGK